MDVTLRNGAVDDAESVGYIVLVLRYLEPNEPATFVSLAQHVLHGTKIPARAAQVLRRPFYDLLQEDINEPWDDVRDVVASLVETDGKRLRLGLTPLLQPVRGGS